MMTHAHHPIAIIGGGPTGLMAAEILASRGLAVTVYESQSSLARKFLRAGIGGLNITHSEDYAVFCTRYGAQQPRLQPMLDHFPPDAVRAWAAGLGIPTFAGSSGRVFPEGMKAAPLLRAWVQRLRGMGVRFQLRHRWLGWRERGSLLFSTPAGQIEASAPATLLAMGGGSWPQLGTDGSWVGLLQEQGISIAPLKSANCGFDVAWSDHLRQHHAGTHVKSIAMRFKAADGTLMERRGELLISEYGVEGSLIYAYASHLRDVLEAQGSATFTLDLAPDRQPEQVRAAVQQSRGARSLASHLKSRLNISGVKMALLWEALGKNAAADPGRLAEHIKALPITVTATRPMAEAISTAGGVGFNEVDQHLMLRAMPGVFVAGEMLDWEAPTGGYLLTACLAQGVWVGEGMLGWLRG